MHAHVRLAGAAVGRSITDLAARTKVRQALVACGLVYAVLYPVVNDAIARRSTATTTA